MELLRLQQLKRRESTCRPLGLRYNIGLHCRDKVTTKSVLVLALERHYQTVVVVSLASGKQN